MSISDEDKQFSELEELSPLYRLHLKPLAKINITVQLPNLYSAQSQHVGQSISNWEVMEKLRVLARPIEFTQWKVIKSSLEFYRFQADVPSKSDVKRVLPRLNGSHLKLSGFSESLLVKASEAKLEFPRRYDWDSFFRDAKDMNEMMPGERPDTVHLQQLPIRWFAEHSALIEDASNSSSGLGTLRPSIKILKKVFEVFGEISEIDIPMLSPLSTSGSHNTSTSSSTTGHIVIGDLGPQLTFEAYIQYKDFLSFVRCMDTLRGKCLAHVHPACLAMGSTVSSTTSPKEQLKKIIRTVEIKVDFDRTKHLSRASIDRRRGEEQRILSQFEKQKHKEELSKQLLEQQLLEEEKKKLDVEKEKEARRLAREESRRKRAEERRQKEKEKELRRKIELDERRVLVANRKLHSVRLLTELLQRAKVREERRIVEKWEQELAEESARLAMEESRRQVEKVLKAEEKEKRKRKRLLDKEEELRNKILKKMKESESRERETQRSRLKKTHSRGSKHSVAFSISPHHT